MGRFFALPRKPGTLVASGGGMGWGWVGRGVGGRESSQSMRNFHRQAEEFGLNLIHPKEKKKKDFRTQGTEKSSTLE